MAKRHRQAGFTLKELALTIAVVAVLFAVLGPFLRKWQEREQSKYACASNMRQLGLALAQYTQDDDQVLPPGKNASGNGWAGQLYQYTKTIGTYKCPYDPHEGNYISYAANRNLTGLNVQKLASPSATVALYEFSTLNCDPSTPEAVSATGTSAPQDSTRHDPTTFALNFVLADGHVKMLLPAQVSNGPSAVSPKILPSGKIVRTFAVK